jgi:hypothetical protein
MIWESKNNDIGKEEGVIGQTQTTWQEFAQAYNEKKDHNCGELKPDNTPLIIKVSCLNKSEPIEELEKLYEISFEYHEILNKKYGKK